MFFQLNLHILYDEKAFVGNFSPRSLVNSSSHLKIKQHKKRTKQYMFSSSHEHFKILLNASFIAEIDENKN